MTQGLIQEALDPKSISESTHRILRENDGDGQESFEFPVSLSPRLMQRRIERLELSRKRWRKRYIRLTQELTVAKEQIALFEDELK